MKFDEYFSVMVDNSFKAIFGNSFATSDWPWELKISFVLCKEQRPLSIIELYKAWGKHGPREQTSLEFLEDQISGRFRFFFDTNQKYSGVRVYTIKNWDSVRNLLIKHRENAKNITKSKDERLLKSLEDQYRSNAEEFQHWDLKQRLKKAGCSSVFDPKWRHQWMQDAQNDI